MKKISLLFFILSSIFYQAQVTVTWSGGGASEFFSEAANWTSSVVPTTTNNIVFDGTSSKNCRIDIPISILGMSINAGYSGVITVTSNTFVTLTGNFSQASGTFNSTTDSLTINSGDLSLTGGSFNHNNGIVVLRVSTSFTSNIVGTISLNKLMVASRGSTSTTMRTVNYGTATTVNHFILNNQGQRFLHQGAMTVSSLLELKGTVVPSGIHTATFTLGGSGNFTMTTTAPNLGCNILPNLVFNTAGNIFLQGAAGGYFSIRGNWTHVSGTFVPGTSTIFTFGSPSIIGTGNAFHHITILNATSLNFPSNNEVKISGDLNILSGGSGIFPTTSLIGFNGTGNQLISWGSSASIVFGSIRVYNTTINRRLTLSSSGINCVIQDSLKVDAGLATEFRGNGKLLLQSTSNLKARIATLGAGASVTGNVTAQTIIPGGFTGWANMGTPGINNQTVLSWDTYLSSGGSTGIPMTCTGCSYGPYEVQNGPFTSIQGWNETTNSYQDYISSTTFSPGIGQWVYVGNGPVNSSNLLLVNTGTLVQGNVSVPITNNSSGYNLVANPYASPIRWSRVFASSSNVNNEIHIWNADIAGYTTCSGTLCTNRADDIIPAGQGFYVLASAAGSVNFQESHKVAFNTGSNPLLRPAGPTAADESIFRLKLSDNNGYEDYTVFRTHQEASFNYDGNLDAHKIMQSPGYAGYPGPYTKYTTISSKDNLNEDYAINSLPILTNSVSIPLLVRVAVSGPHKIEPIEIENFNTCVFLRDKLTDTYHNLKTDGAYNFTISDTTTVPRFEIVMCQQRAANPNSVAELLSGEKLFIGQDDKSVFVTTHLLQNSKAKISAYNLVGQKLMEDVFVDGQDKLTRLNLNISNQVVIIKVQTEQESLTKKVLVF